MKRYIAADQYPRSAIAIGQHDAERVFASRLAVVAHIHLIGEPTPTVDLGCTLDMTGRRPGHRVCRHPGSLDLHVGSMVDIGEMAPTSAVLDPTSHTEGP